MQPILIILLIILWIIDACASFYQSGSVFPVYQHWKALDVEKIARFNSDRKSYGVSLFPLVETKHVKPILHSCQNSIVCFDVEKAKDVHDLHDSGCRVIGTHVKHLEVIREAKLRDMTVICSGALPSDYNNALMLNADAFRVVLNKPMPFQDCKEFVDKVRLDNLHLDIPVFVSPVIEGDDMERIAALDGMIQFMIKFRLDDEDGICKATELLSAYNERLRKAYLDLRINDDLRSSCL